MIGQVAHTCVSLLPSSVIWYQCKSRGGNGRLWKRCGLPSITPGVSPLPAQNHEKGDEHPPQRRIVCVRKYTDHGNNLPLPFFTQVVLEKRLLNGHSVVVLKHPVSLLLLMSDCMYRFSSRFEEDIPAVVGFAYQEPENDPRHFGYLWVVRGQAELESMFVLPFVLLLLLSCFLCIVASRVFGIVRLVAGKAVAD